MTTVKLKTPLLFTFLRNFILTTLMSALLIIPNAQPGWPQTEDDNEFALEDFDTKLSLDEEWDDYEETLMVKDPFEGYNRFMFGVNDKIYRWVFNPISKGYEFLFPKFVQKRFNNIVRLASTPKRFFNNLFQKKFKAGGIEASRLLINASIGLGGLFDPAKSAFGLEQQTEDFNQTLGYYGMDNGPYIIAPIIGPLTGRSALGMVVDTAFSPFFWFSIYDVSSQTAFTAFSNTKRANTYTFKMRDGYNQIVEPAIDPYIAVQNAYIQNINNQVNDSRPIETIEY